ncbi:hypothetical protein AJ80_05450 [Polytolypa hystricis UAMH7299]|uniref:Cytochrome P450 n=1 Tax=Polytolypa hystricis (strain UAMH7299) TaxID=1447883 RepID=A0A2B7Y4I6_POLH7|nr:hypothetical protein AJ80_05450 [Polytolypa hystricis UAMH7299]
MLDVSSVVDNLAAAIHSLGLGLIPIALVVYLILRSIYRVYFHPLSKIPGPKLAAMTRAYEFYFEVIKGGQFIWEMKRMHEVALYTAPRSALATLGHDLHRFRRGMMNSFFSKRSVAVLEPAVQAKIDRMCERFEEAAKEKRIIPISAALGALSGDIISQYSYGWSTHFIENENFENKFLDALSANIAVCHYIRFWPFLGPLLDYVPVWIAEKVEPKTKFLLDLKQQLYDQSVNTINNRRTDMSKGSMTIFEALSDPSIPASEREPGRLQEESFIVLVAGTETTARSMSTDGDANAYQQGFLIGAREIATACINEALRLGHTAVIRLPRIAPHESLIYKDYVIPPGTPVSQSLYFVHMNPTVFPDPEKFDPERWLKAAENGERLTKFLVPLAQCELFLTLGNIFRRFELEPYETTYEGNIRVTRDYFVGVPRDEEAVIVKARVVRVLED